MNTTELPAPTIVDLVDTAVGSLNNLIVYLVNVDDKDNLGVSAAVWGRLVEADYAVNSAQDAIWYARGVIDQEGNKLK
jgi:hypothetical protein